jgi:Zn-dependent protease
MKRIKIHAILGTKIYIDLFCLFSSALLVVVFALYILPFYFRHLPAASYWWMSIRGIILVFATVYLQSIGRILCCYLVGATLKSCTLYLLGSIPEYCDHRKGNVIEFFSVVVGCMVSIVSPICCFLFLISAKKMGWPSDSYYLFNYLFFIAAILGLCNIFPLYPLDGGKLFKIILSLTSKDESWAHRFVCRFGAVFSLLILYAGILMVLSGMVTSGICVLIIGVSSHRAVTKSVQSILLCDQFKGVPITKAMKQISCTVREDTPIHQFLSEYVYRKNEDVYPVIDEKGRITNLITARQVVEIPVTNHENMTLGDIESQTCTMPMIDKRCEILSAFSTMQQTGIKRFVVIDSLLSCKVLGLVTADDIIVTFLKVMHGVRI